MAGYYAALEQARRSGQTGRIVPSGPAGNITYRFIPSGSGGGTTRTVTGGGINSAALTALRKAKEQYAPGGGFGKGVEAGLERGRVKAMASGMQHLVGAGLAGTTMAGGLGLKFEEEVGVPARLGIEEERARALSGIEMAEAGMGFEAGQAGLQRGFQAGESAASRSLQKYIADLQANLQRGGMASRGPTMTAPTGGGYARQFPSLYDQNTAVPDWTGGGGTTPPGSPQALWEAGTWEKSLTEERRRAGPEGLYGTKYEWAT